MSDIDILDRMIRDDAKVLLKDYFGKKKVVLTEPQASDSEVVIFGMPENSIVINVDQFWSLDKMFNHLNGQCKRADFVIVADDGAKKAIVYIEMKRTRARREKDIIQQLTGAQCFIGYCREIGRAKAFWNEPRFLQDYEERFISFRRTGIPKQKTRTDLKTSVHNRPDQMLKISSPTHLTFNHLAGKGWLS